MRTQSLTLDGIGGCHPLLITNFNIVFSAGVVKWHVSYILWYMMVHQAKTSWYPLFTSKVWS